MVKLQRVKDQYTISIPIAQIKDIGWVKGDELVVNYDSRNKELILRKV